MLASTILAAVLLSSPPPAPPSGPPPATQGQQVSAAQTTAEDNYDNGDHQAAAVVFHEIAEGRSPGDARRAQFWLGKALFQLQLPTPALSTFDVILEAGPSHPYHRTCLPWLAALSRELPDGSGVLSRIGSYQGTDLEDPAFEDVRDELYFLLGRDRYERGRLGEAIGLFSLVPRQSDYFVGAQFLTGVAETRELHGPEAVEAFKRVLRAGVRQREAWEEAGKNLYRIKRLRRRIERNDGDGKRNRSRRLRRRLQRTLHVTTSELELIEENERFQERATLALGYIFYQVGRFETANKYFDRVEPESPYWLDAIRASAWNEFRLVELEQGNANRHYQRTLGHVHTLMAPVFGDRMYPEAPILRAVTYYFNCRYGAAKLALQEFEERYLGTRDQLREVLADKREDFELYGLSVDIRAHQSALHPFVQQVAAHALSDGSIDRQYAYVEALDREQERLGELDAPVREGRLGDQADETIELARSVAKERAGSSARQRLEELIAQVNRQERQAIRIEYEILNRLKAKGPDIRGEKQKPFVDSEHEVYRYNGEIWADELGYYNYGVTSLCSE